MKKISRSLLRVFIFALSLVMTLSLCVNVQAATVEPDVDLVLEGCGTKDEPFLIRNYEDLCAFRDYVNSGITFAGQYIKQCDNIDMLGENWTPIGFEDTAFYGVYDGGGHYVENLAVFFQETEINYNGFFGTLGGTVVNFGIETGLIQGDFCGSIASRSVGKKAAILNCYSKATVMGIRAGGLADNFAGNVVACSWFDGDTVGETTAAVSHGGDVKVYHIYTTDDHAIVTSDVNSPTSGRLTKAQLNTDWFLNNLNLSAGLTRYLFATNYSADLMQWEIGADGKLTYSENTGYLTLFGFLNSYFLPLVLALVLLAYVCAFAKAGKARFWFKHKQDIIAIAIISVIVAVFVDTAMISKGLAYLTLGNGMFMVLIHVMAIFFGTIALKNLDLKFKKEWIPLVVAILLISILELLQFDLIPKYDAGIYYGSLVQGVDLFRIDFLTYIGAFVCWKWIHGLVLLIGPLEFLMHGQMIGVYIANMAINAVTMMCMYGVLRRISPKMTPLLATFGSLAIILCPYQLGLFTYLSMDPHAALFAVWLLYAYLNNSAIMVSFCGYLLSFNKISGMVFYVFFLLTMGVFEALETEGKNLFRKILNWWSWKKVLLWIFPAVAFLATMVLGDDLTIQVFYGAYTGAGRGFKNLHEIMNTLTQSFIYGFRWLFTLGVLVALIALCFQRRKMRHIATRQGIEVLVASFAGCLGVVLILCLYQGDADCPRYTELMNVFFAVSFPVVIRVLFKRRLTQCLAAGCMVLLLLIQTYWTIDPVILLTSESIDTGKKPIYKLALSGDTRPGMNIGKDYGPGYVVVCDLFAYNLEHSYYDSLIDDVLTQIQPDENTQFLQLDIMWYETHIYGNKYRIYWNTRTNSRTYDANDPDSIFLGKQLDVFTKDICAGNFAAEDTFYLLVPARVDPTDAKQGIELKGYTLFDEIYAENPYGAMYAFGYTRNN